MIQKIGNIVKVKKVTAVGIFYTGQQEAEYSSCSIHVKGTTISVSNRQMGIKSLEELKTLIPGNIPVILNISGKIVLNKVYTTKEGTSQTSQYVPENQKEDFYCYEYEQPETTGLSICRKHSVDQVISGFIESGLQVIDLTLGPFPAVSLRKMGIIQTDAIQLQGTLLHVNPDTGIFHIDSGVKNNEPQKVALADEIIDNRLLVTYASAISWLTDFKEGDFYGQIPGGIKKDYLFKQYIHVLKYPALGLLLLILLVNFLLFESYRKKEAFVGSQIELNSGIISKRDSLESILNAKERYLEYIGKNITWFSYELDQIASTVPSEIILERLDINPLTEKVQKSEQLLFEKMIRIRGQAANSLILNEWSHSLAEFNWISDVNVKNFTRNNETGQGIFLLEISIKND